MMLKLKRLKIEKFRSLARGTELAFSDGINVVLGQNGTGKTTLLELISMVARSDFSELAKEPFAVEYELLAADRRLVFVVKNTIIKNTGESNSQPLAPDTELDLRPSLEVLDERGAQLLRYDPVDGLLVHGQKYTSNGFRAPLDITKVVATIVFPPGMGQAAFNALFDGRSAYRMDESLELWKKVTAPDSRLGQLYENLDGTVGMSLVPMMPMEITGQIAVPSAFQKTEYLFKHGNFSVLPALASLMGFSSVELRVEPLEQSRWGAHQRLTARLGNLLFRFRWPDDTFITHDQLSYGQKRLLVFFYYLSCNPSIVIADELVNGLHHRWIAASIERIEQRQAFLTSQNPLLLDYIPITSPSEVRQSFVLCRGESQDGKQGWLWENMGAEDANELFNAYEVGIEHVSEILQSRGLW